MNNATMWGIWIVVDLSRTSRIWYIHFLFEATLELGLICQEFVDILFKSEVYGLLDHEECSLICCSVYDSVIMVLNSLWLAPIVLPRDYVLMCVGMWGQIKSVHKTD